MISSPGPPSPAAPARPGARCDGSSCRAAKRSPSSARARWACRRRSWPWRWARVQPRILLDGARAQAAAADTYRQLSLFGDVFERVRADYVEKPDDSKLIESAINGMLAGLDPHSSYMDSKSFRDMQVQTRGEFGGLGIEVTMEDGLIKVVAPIDETPAAKAGIMANDIITHLDDEPVQGLTLNQAVEKMRGPENSKIK